MGGEFDFQEWAELARRSPADFERRRREVIQAFLDSAGNDQQRMGVALQREIDYEIRRAGDPQDALAAISRMMWSQVEFLCEELQALSSSMHDLEAVSAAGMARIGRTLQATEAGRG